MAHALQWDVAALRRYLFTTSHRMALTSHIVNGKFMESGTAQNKQAAKEAASKATLIKLGYQFCKLPIPTPRPVFVLIWFRRFGPRRTSHFSRVLDTLPSCMQRRSEILYAICLLSIISIVSSPLSPREPANISIVVQCDWSPNNSSGSLGAQRAQIEVRNPLPFAQL